MAGYRYAFSLPKDEVRDATPLGTAVLIDHELVRTQTGNHEFVEDHLQLIPEPSPDPSDPLNFSKWRKITILLLMGLYAFTTNVSSSIISSALPTLVTAWAHYGEGPPTGIVPFTSLTHLIAVNNLMLGAANIWWVPLGNTFGRRPVLLACLLLLTVCSVWCGEAKSFNSLLAARVFQGAGGAAADTLAPDVVGQVFFVHQRGRALAIYTMFLASGSLAGGLVGGYITSSLGWRWTCYIPAIMAAGLLILTFLLVPETLFDREQAMAVLRSHSSYENSDGEKKQEIAHLESVNFQVFPSYTFTRSLRMSTYRPGLLKRVFTPYITLLFPGTWMVMLQYAGLVGLVVSLSTVAPNLLAAPPYLWGANIGLINAGGLVGTIVGAVYTYLSADWWTKRTARRQSHGYSEPEARIPLLFPGVVIAVAGALAFGFCADSGTQIGWVGLEFGMGMISFGLMIVPSIGFNYIIEAYGGWASDCFLMVVTFRAIVSFAWTFFVGTWTAESGFALPFGIFAMLMGLFGLVSVPVWLFGKKFRIAGQNTIGKAFNRGD